jgi:YidC/Oxa1 family membrane protein insertase
VDIYSFAPIAAVLDAAYSVVTALAALLEPIAGAAGSARAIVLITLAQRTVYKKNPQLLQQKTMEFYASEKASPLAGMLPTLLQAPVLSVVYGLFILPTVNGHSNGLLAQHLLGVPLGTSMVHLLGARPLGPDVLVFAGLLLVIGVVAYAARRVALRLATPLPDDAAPGMRRVNAVLSWLPFLTVLFAALVPLAATIYLTVTTAWTLVERQVLRHRLAPLDYPA